MSVLIVCHDKEDLDKMTAELAKVIIPNSSMTMDGTPDPGIEVIAFSYYAHFKGHAMCITDPGLIHGIKKRYRESTGNMGNPGA